MKKKLMIIDNAGFDREVMKKIFSDFYDVSVVENGNCCGKIVNDIQPDVVYYELRSPDMEALITVFESIHSIGQEKPFLIVSVTENTEDIERYARMNGVFYYLIRPFNLNELWDAVESASSMKI